MKCPICKETDLLMTERMGVEIDYCPQCRGIWLDRGELDKLLEKAEQSSLPATSHNYNNELLRKEKQHHKEHEHHGYSEHGRSPHPSSSRRSWLGNLLDFD